VRSLYSPMIKLIIFLVITAVFTYVLGATIANSSYGSTRTYHAYFTDVTGLNLNDDVRIAGVRVGTVDDMKLIKGDANHASYTEVTFTVLKSRPLPKTVDARLRYRNLVGQRYVDIEQGAGSPKGTPLLTSKDVIPLAQTSPAVDLTVLFAGFTQLTDGLAPDEINKLSYSLIQTLQGEGGALENLFATVASLTNALADKDKVIGEVIDNLSSVLTTVGQHDTELTNLIVELRKFIGGLADDRTTIGNSIDGINNLATSTAGLLTQVRAPLKKDIVDITGLVNTLNDNSGVLKYVIKNLPTTLAPLIRTADYGSWFNFYLCQATVSVAVGNGKPVDVTPTIPFGDATINKERGCAS
jgi:phospholipid/cholesterol/gamma-HCH transport system substrate-binding protein